MKRFPNYFPALIFILSLGLYWYTANPLPSGYADSDELITAGHLLSVAHPPGYGLNVILTGLFQRLFFFLSPAHASNLLAGVLHAATLTLIYQTAFILLPSSKKRPQLQLFLGVLIGGANALFWLYSSVIEVMSLSDVFVVLILYQTIKWLKTNQSPQPSTLIAISLTFGVGTGHYQPLILIGPALLVAYFSVCLKQPFRQHLKSLAIVVVASTIGFLLSSALILPLASRQQAMSWSFPFSLNGWWGMITRQDYTGAFFDKNLTVENSYTQGFSLEFINRIPQYLIATWNHFAGLPAILIIFGFYFLWKTVDRRYFGFIFTSLLFGGLIFSAHVTYSGYQPTDLHYRLLVGTAERQYLMGYTILILVLALGAIYISKHKYSTLILAAALVSTLIANFPMANQKHNNLVYNYNSQMLEAAQPNSIIICTSDFACFGLFYQNLVEHKRPDVAIIAKNTRQSINFLKRNPTYADFVYPENPNYLGHLIAYNLPRRPTYITSVSQFEIEYYGLDGNPFYVHPQGYLNQIDREPPTSPPEPQTDGLIKSLVVHPIDHRDFHLLGFTDYLASHYQVVARYMTRYSYSNQAKSALDHALYLYPNDPRVIDWRLRLNQFINNFEAAPKLSTSSAEYLELAQNYLAQNQLYQSEEAARKSYYLDPVNPKPLEFLLNLYQQYNYPMFADWINQHLKALNQSSP